MIIIIIYKGFGLGFYISGLSKNTICCAQVGVYDMKKKGYAKKSGIIKEFIISTNNPAHLRSC
jgi:hypothetical protein